MMLPRDPGFVSGFIGVSIDVVIHHIFHHVSIALLCKEELNSLTDLVITLQKLGLVFSTQKILERDAVICFK